MGALKTALQIIQILISVALIAVIILQAKDAGIGNLFGGGDAGMGVTKTRRGLEKTLFQITIVLAALFLVNAILQLGLS
jgi:preprotein translocase subunit SecG